eukprot:scaffold16892_cov35-Prasinocladus_malaysianus.AAC.2
MPPLLHPSLLRSSLPSFMYSIIKSFVRVFLLSFHHPSQLAQLPGANGRLSRALSILLRLPG